MDKNNRLGIALLLLWLGLIILSIVTGHFHVPEELKTSWHNFTTATPEARTTGIFVFIILAIITTIVSFVIGGILLPLEIVVFPIIALLTLNGFWLTTFIVWKYELLFAIVF